MSDETRLIGRREFLRAGLGAGAGLALVPLLAACGGREEVLRMSFLNWQDYIAAGTLDQFVRETGISIVYETYASNDELEERLIQAARPGGAAGPAPRSI
jgi:spermidine/putrescine-binding protein